MISGFRVTGLQPKDLRDETPSMVSIQGWTSLFTMHELKAGVEKLKPGNDWTQTALLWSALILKGANNE